MIGIEHSFGTIKVKTEFTEEPEKKVQTLHDVTTEYRSLGYEDKEHSYALFLDNGNNLIGDKLLGLGTTKETSVDIKDIARTALLVNAGAVILVHNHPSGSKEPTTADIETTQEVDKVLDQLDIRLLDHVIITRNGSHSMRKNSEGPFKGGR